VRRKAIPLFRPRIGFLLHDIHDQLPSPSVIEDISEHQTARRPLHELA
jgi:hypothetical protein